MNNNFMLDNAAKIYPAAMTKGWNAVFRTAVYIDEPVSREILAKAVVDLAPRFPSFYVQLHEGRLWDSFVPAENLDIVFRDMYGICNPFPVGRGRMPLFRVLYKDNMIAAEFFHAVTDGNGALVYLKTLTARYFELRGIEIEKADGVLDINEQPKESEFRDAFQSLYKKSKRVSRSEDNAYQYKPERQESLRATSVIIPIDEIKSAAAEYGCTVTAYLGAVYAYSFLKQYKNEALRKRIKRNIKISVPVNLRPYFECDTLRNFSSFVNISVNPNEVKSFEDALNAVKGEMKRLIDIEKIRKSVSQNVAEEKMLISRIAPNKLKKIVMKRCFLEFGEKKYTSPLSNLGMISVPKEMENYVERFEVVIGKTLLNSVYCSAAGFKNNLTVTISSVAAENEIEAAFLETLKENGVAFKVNEIGMTKKAVRVRENETAPIIKKSSLSA